MKQLTRLEQISTGIGDLRQTGTHGDIRRKRTFLQLTRFAHCCRDKLILDDDANFSFGETFE